MKGIQERNKTSKERKNETKIEIGFKEREKKE